MSEKNLQSSINKENIKIQNWVLICYGNILRSQVLEQYLRHYAKLWDIQITFYSAGIAKWDEFPNTSNLLVEVHRELQKRSISCFLQRNTWSNEVENSIISADIVLCADTTVKKKVLERMNDRINVKKVFTFYNKIGEGEIDFEDTYDYVKKRQDPIRFRDAFDEIDRISQKILV
ncbi:MAG: hypothetical protein J7L77_08755, partial [Clostridiales bacterium]|nr:hypothetical protein [Clostridiales bacterium]